MKPLRVSGVATGGLRGQSAPLTAKKIAKNREKEGENEEKEGKIEKKRTNRQGSFTLPLLTDRAGYATAKGTKMKFLLDYVIYFIIIIYTYQG